MRELGLEIPDEKETAGYKWSAWKSITQGNLDKKLGAKKKFVDPKLVNKFPLYLQIKFGEANEKDLFTKKEIGDNVDSNYVQKMLICPANKPFKIETERIFQYIDK